MSIGRFVRFLGAVLLTAGAGMVLTGDLWRVVDGQGCRSNSLCNLVNHTPPTLLFQAYLVLIAGIAGTVAAHQTWANKSCDLRVYLALSLIPAGAFDLLYNLKWHSAYPVYRQAGRALHIPGAFAVVLDVTCLIVGACHLIGYIRDKRSSSRYGAKQT